MTTMGCAKRWHAAQPAPANDHQGHSERLADSFDACRSCPIGAAHAGSEVVTYTAMFGAKICPRCRRGATRFIRDRLCVSCYNRENELVSGRNARGNVPAQLKPLTSIPCKIVVDGVSRNARVDRVVDGLEAMMQTLRTTRGAVAFGFRGCEGGLSQARLF